MSKLALKHAGAFDDFGDGVFLVVGHDVDAGDAFNFAQLANEFD